MFKLGRSHRILCAPVYLPPKYSSDIFTDFSVFLADIVLKYDHIPIVCDFNICIGCPETPIEGFLKYYWFNLVQSVQYSTCTVVQSVNLLMVSLFLTWRSVKHLLNCNSLKPCSAARRLPEVSQPPSVSAASLLILRGVILQLLGTWTHYLFFCFSTKQHLWRVGGQCGLRVTKMCWRGPSGI